jgi:hypothetical protein
MSEELVMSEVSFQKQGQIDEVIELAETLDFTDIQILRKFYLTNKSFPNDTQPHCFPILYREMQANKQIKIGMEAFRKRLDNLVKLNLLEKVKHSNPTNYSPINGKEAFVRAIITRFFLINGLSKFIQI